MNVQNTLRTIKLLLSAEDLTDDEKIEYIKEKLGMIQTVTSKEPI